MTSSFITTGETVKRAYEAFQTRDLETLEEISDPEIEISSVTGILSGRDRPYQGVEALADYVRDVDRVWDEIELVPEEYHELDEQRVLVFGRVRARRGDIRIDTPNAWLWQLRGEKVVSVQVYAEPSADAIWLYRKGPWS